jgi:hypothetical protein
MLEQLSDQIRACHERAADAKTKADATRDEEHERRKRRRDATRH